MAKPKRGGLGRGLGALIPAGGADDDAPAPKKSTPAPPPTPVESESGERLVHLDPTTILPNPKQPRKVFDEDALQELAESIRMDGVQEPVIVREVNGEFELVSGERRVKASVMADKDLIPAICRDVSDRDMLKLGLIENIQREDLNPIETAEAYDQLIEEFGWTQDELADRVGKKRATVTNTLRLLKLPHEVRDGLSQGLISMGHARALLAIPNAKAQVQAFAKVVRNELSVRETEALASKKPGAGGKSSGKSSPAKDPNVTTFESELRRTLGTKVNLRPSGKESGKIEIEYYSYDDLERILDALRGRK